MMDEYNAIIESDLPEAERVVRSFALVMRYYTEVGEREIELARAMGDRERLVKEQIKLASMRHAASILYDSYRRVTGKRMDDA